MGGQLASLVASAAAAAAAGCRWVWGSAGGAAAEPPVDSIPTGGSEGELRDTPVGEGED